MPQKCLHSEGGQTVTDCAVKRCAWKKKPTWAMG